jgi:proline iminopeptidase
MESGFKVQPATKSGHLDVGNGHRVYYEQRGNIKNGIPVVVVHGGPGGNTVESQLKVYDPEKYHIISFDQRGCGKSKPKGEIDNNTTDLLIQDMERLRQELDIPLWAVAGDSWGSTLALLYAEQHRERVLGLLLRGVFLGRQQDVEAFLSPGGVAAIRYPEAWSRFLKEIDEGARGDARSILSAFQEKINSDDYVSALHAWNRWEILCSVTPALDSKKLDEMERDIEVGAARIELAYIMNQFYRIDENSILKSIDVLKGLRVYISQGTYDYVCWPETQAKALSDALNALDDTYVTSVYIPHGHAGSDPEMVAYKVQAANMLAEQVLRTWLLANRDITMTTSAALQFKILSGVVIGLGFTVLALAVAALVVFSMGILPSSLAATVGIGLAALGIFGLSKVYETPILDLNKEDLVQLHA